MKQWHAFFTAGIVPFHNSPRVILSMAPQMKRVWLLIVIIGIYKFRGKWGHHSIESSHMVAKVICFFSPGDAEMALSTSSVVSFPGPLVMVCVFCVAVGG